jgi:hypothetical protein
MSTVTRDEGDHIQHPRAVMIGSHCIEVDVNDDLQPLCDEILGNGITLDFAENPMHIYGHFYTGESKWCLMAHVGPHTDGMAEMWTTVDTVQAKAIKKNTRGDDTVDPLVFLNLLFNLGKVPEASYIITREW